MRYKPNCKTCQLSKGPQNVKIRQRILKAKFRREPGDETMSQIAAELGINWATFSNHCAKHISERSVDSVTVNTAKKIQKVKVKQMKEMEIAFDHTDVVGEMDFERAAREIVALGIERLERGDITVTTTQLLQAIKIKSDYESKKRGQNTEIIKTMYRYASGQAGDKDKTKEESSQEAQNEEPDGPTTRPTESPDPGEDRPSYIHKQVAWDALARRAEALSTGNNPTQG